MSQGISIALMASGMVLKVLILLNLTLGKSRYLRGIIPPFYRCQLLRLSLWIYSGLLRKSGVNLLSLMRFFVAHCCNSPLSHLLKICPSLFLYSIFHLYPSLHSPSYLFPLGWIQAPWPCLFSSFHSPLYSSPFK